MTFAKFPHSAGTKAVPLADPGFCAGRGNAAALCVADCLSLAAAPTFAIMALVTGVLGGGPMDALCSGAQDASPLNGMVMMYLLMSAFHSAPWLKLISSLRGTRRSGDQPADQNPAKLVTLTASMPGLKSNAPTINQHIASRE